MEKQPVLYFHDIKKRFGENIVLNGVDFKIMPGEVISLVGENGAGKSTLMNILFGMDVIRRTGGYEGEVYIAGKVADIKTPMDAIQYGIGMVHQEFMLIPSFSIAQNVKLNREPLKKTFFSRILGKTMEKIDEEQEEKDTQLALKRIGIDVNPNTQISMLPVGIKQFIEIAREIDKENLRLLVFDEPTAVLTESEAEKLISCIKEFSRSGISIIFISHRLDEVIEVSDRIVILRDGVLVENVPTGGITKEQIAEKMVGREFNAEFQCDEERNISDKEIIMEFKNISVDMPGEILKNFSLSIRKNEILGIGGLAGQGKMAISNAVSGMYPSIGVIEFEGQKLNVNKTGEALKHKISFVSEDRKGVGLLLDQSIEDNIVFTNMTIRNEFLKKFGPLKLRDDRKISEISEKMIKELNIKCTSGKQLVGSLSGGNQQKVCMARALIANPKLLFVSEPTRGIDIGAKKLILDYLKKINYEMGITIVMISSELNELRSICDRIAIISNGRLGGILSPDASNVDFALTMFGDKRRE